MIGVMEGIRRLRLGTAVQVLTSTCVICLIHSLRYTLWGFVVAPSFLIDAGTFVYWRELESFWVGSLMMFTLHVTFNAVPAIAIIAERLR
jgi:hypothetical protein